MTPSAEVVVIGGGVIGTSITHSLAKRGVDVVLVERGDIGSGTSSACQGGISLSTKTLGPKLALAVESLKIHHMLQEELGQDLGFRNEGSMIVAQTEGEVEFLISRTAQYRDAGIDVRFLDAEETRAMQPALSDHVLGSMYSCLDCQANPMKLNLAFARKAKELGAEIHTFNPVTGLKADGGAITAVITSKGEIETSTVVNATGAWAPSIAKMVDLELPIVPRRGQILVTEPTPPFLNGMVLAADYLLSKKMPSSGKKSKGKMMAGVIAIQTETGNFLLGSTRSLAGFDRRNTHEGIIELARRGIQLVPPLGKLHIIRTYAGLRPATPDGLPILERSPQLPGFIVAAGHAGDAIALSPITGEKIAQLITGEIGEEALAPFASSRFKESAGKEVKE